MHAYKFMRDNVVAPFVPPSVVIATVTAPKIQHKTIKTI